ncbi:MAG: hypothetical protein ACRCSG_08930 [Cellulosilyticaceae bacterium]
MNRNFWITLIGILLPYSIFAYLMAWNWDSMRYFPIVMVIASLCLFFIVGTMLNKKINILASFIAVILPNIIADTCYFIALQTQNTRYIEYTRSIVPHTYGSISLWSGVAPSTRFIIMTVIITILSVSAVLIGAYISEKRNTLVNWSYNNVIAWFGHFILFTILISIVSKFPLVMFQEKEKLILTFGVTALIFVVYLFIGRFCRNIKNPIIHLTSMMSVTVTALIYYIMIFVVPNSSSRFEYYILPVANSFFGVMCQKLGEAMGNIATKYSQFGFLATAIMIFIPVILMYIGNKASISEENKVENKIENKIE